MYQFLGVAFLALATVFTICIAYCVWMALVDDPTWLFVSIGILFSDIVAILIAWQFLRSPR